MITKENAYEVFDKYGIPEHCRDGLYHYLFERIEPGSFLTSVLANDLVGAINNADDINILAIKSYVLFMYWELPARDVPNSQWGSYEAVERWLDSKE